MKILLYVVPSVIGAVGTALDGKILGAFFWMGILSYTVGQIVQKARDS